MAACCALSTKSFVNELVTNMAYAGAELPKVKVMYLDTDTGQWIAAGILTRIEIEGGIITVDHGGPASGIIQLIQ